MAIMDSLMLLYVCVYLYMHGGQYSPVCTLHMISAHYVISTLQGFSCGCFMCLLSFSFPP